MMIESPNKLIESALQRAMAAAEYHPALGPPGLLRPTVPPVPMEKILFGLGVAQKEVVDLTRAAAAAALPALRLARPDILADQTPLAGLLFVSRGGGCIMVRANDPTVRRRFSAAHELGHYLMHFHPDSLGDDVEEQLADDVLGVIGNFDNADTEGVDDAALHRLDEREQQANEFAAELLMPEPLVRGLHAFYADRFGDTPRFLENHIAGDLLVSRQAIRRRLADLGLAPIWMPT